MHINTKMRIFAFCYLVCAFTIALPVIALFFDLVIGGGIIDILKKVYSFTDLLSMRKSIYLKLAGIGAMTGFLIWLVSYSKYVYHDPLDKYFK